MLCEDHAVMEVVGQFGLDGCHSLMLLQADNSGHGRHGEVSYRLPLPSRRLELSRSLAAYEGSLPAGMLCLGCFLEAFLVNINATGLEAQQRYPSINATAFVAG